MQNSIECVNISVPEGKERQKEEIFIELMAEKFPSLYKDKNPHTQNVKQDTLKEIHKQVYHSKNDESQRLKENFNTAIEKLITYDEIPIILTADFLAEMIEERGNGIIYFKCLKNC